jgi:hypothetical protein
MNKQQYWKTGTSLFAVLGFTATPLVMIQPAVSRTTFIDVQGHWAQLCIEELARQGAVTGFLDGTFRPDVPMTRGEFATVVSQAFPNAPAVSTDTPFFDVPSQTRTGTAVRNARQSGFLAGFPSGVFRPEDTVTRIQAIVSLTNGLKLQPRNFSIAELSLIYDDVKDIPNYGINAVVAATENRLLVNYPEIRFVRPNTPATRAEVAAFVCQALATSGTASLVPQQYVVSAPNSGGTQTAVQTAPSPGGLVQGTLTYQKQNYVFSDLRLTVVRGDQTLLNTPLPVLGGVSSSVAFRVVDLDGDTEPEILIDLFPRGQGCCAYSLVYRYLPATQQYSYIQQPWGYASYQLKDFNQDGIPEFETQDARFNSRFTTAATGGVAPLQILQYRQGQMFDVTRQYPNQIAENTNQLWQTYQLRRSLGEDVKDVLAAYLANQFLLGQGQQGFSEVQSTYDGQDRDQYLDNLRTFLRSTGYYR